MKQWTWSNVGALRDTDGKFLHSHGGHLLHAEDGYYYLYGEYGEFDLTGYEGRKVSCYRSRDLTNWENRGVVLDVHTPRAAYVLTKHTNPTMERSKQPPVEERWAGWADRPEVGATIQRPKILYNARTGKYVLWMHWEDGMGFALSHCAVASSDRPDGPFVYHGSFRPAGCMSRDSTVFQDEDGTAYFISAARDNADFHIYRLTEDYMAIDEYVKCLFPDQYREAPALFKRKGVYFLLSSECMGAEPNQCMYSWTRDLLGRWSSQQPLGTPTTFDTQPAFVMTLNSPDETHYFYVGDRWNPTEFYRNARYIVLPLTFPTDTSLAMDWCDAFTLDLETGKIVTQSQPTGLIRIKSRITEEKGPYLLPLEDGSIGSRRLEYGQDCLYWQQEPVDEATVRLRHVPSGQYLQAGLDGVTMAQPADVPQQCWRILPLEDGSCRILALDGRALALPQDQPPEATRCYLNTPRNVYDPAWGCDEQAFIMTTVYPY